MTDRPEGRPPRGLARDFHRAREGTKASAEELREFVREFRGKSPQEVLGLVAGSSLIRSTALAAVVTLIFMAAFTIGPYLLRSPQATAQGPKPVAPAAPAAAPAAPAPTATVAPAVPAPTAAAAVPAGANVPPSPDVLELGLGESKAKPPTKNPLDGGADDLLKDLK